MPNALNIPQDLQANHYTKIRGFLGQILKQLKARGTGAKRVVSRLNRSDRQDPAPVFVGVLEDSGCSEIRKEQGYPRSGDVGRLRFKDENPSKVYAEALNDPQGAIRTRDWNSPGHDREKREAPGSKSMGVRAGCVHQRFIAIRIPDQAGHCHVGTITVGFCKNPSRRQEREVEKILRHWSQEDSKYVQYLKDNFTLNGPTF